MSPVYNTTEAGNLTIENSNDLNNVVDLERQVMDEPNMDPQDLSVQQQQEYETQPMHSEFTATRKRDNYSWYEDEKHNLPSSPLSSSIEQPTLGLLTGEEAPRRHSREALLIIKSSILASATVFLLCIYALFTHPFNHSGIIKPHAPTGTNYPSGFNMKQNWGSFSPYFDSGPEFPGISPQQPSMGLNGLPLQCEFKQVHVLHRHAERYPTPGTDRQLQKLAEKLKSLAISPDNTELNWLKQWEYQLKTDLLVSTGTASEFDSGALFWATHGRHLFNATKNGYLFYDPVLNVYDNGTARPIPVLRATTQSRIQTSARSWAAGFFGIYGDDPLRQKHITEEAATGTIEENGIYKLVLQTEGAHMNNTLAGYFSCPNANNASYVTGSKRMTDWANIYMKDAAHRLQTQLFKTTENITALDAYYMQHLCTHETAVFGVTSPFCNFFTAKEWEGFEYSHDLSFYGSAGHGCTVGAAEGAGWIYELLARLEQRLIHVPEYGVNVTMTNSESVFPLDQRLYVDLSHDSVIVSVLTALNLDLFSGDKLDSTKLNNDRQFKISRLTPFGARLYVEIYSCNDNSYDSDHDDALFVRLKLNNRILPLAGLKYCTDDSPYGQCQYDLFIKSLHHALSQIDFDQTCYGVPKGW